MKLEACIKVSFKLFNGYIFVKLTPNLSEILD